MPSTSSLFGRLVFSLVARCAEAKRKMAFFCCSAYNAAWVFFCPCSNSVRAAVLLRIDKQQVLNSVILCVFIYMMYVYAFWGVSHNSMFVLPFIWLCYFHLNVYKSFSRGMQSSAPNRKTDTNRIQNALTYRLNLWCKRFICAIRASWCVVVRIAVSAFFPYDRSTAKRAWFRQKFFHARIVCQQ